jgi:hypothetical protein
MAVFKGGRWRSARTGRWVRNPTVAKQLAVPPRAVSGTGRYPKRWTEVTAVCRIRLGDRYVEALRRISIKDATRRQLRDARAAARADVRRMLAKKLRTSERPKLAKALRKATRVEQRRRVRRPARERKVEVRSIRKKDDERIAATAPEGLAKRYI